MRLVTVGLRCAVNLKIFSIFSPLISFPLLMLLVCIGPLRL